MFTLIKILCVILPNQYTSTKDAAYINMNLFIAVSRPYQIRLPTLVSNQELFVRKKRELFGRIKARIVVAGISETERKWRNDSNKWATQVNFAAWAIEVLF